MKSKKTTAGKTAKKAAAVQPVTYRQTSNALTITLRGSAFANLKAIADAMNATSWCGTDSTPMDVVDIWCGQFLDQLAEPGRYYKNIIIGGIDEVAADFVTNLETEEPEGSPADKRKRDELRKQLQSHGLLRKEAAE